MRVSDMIHFLINFEFADADFENIMLADIWEITG